ncbi:hypothetical protein BDZ91DRAFT_649312 [Kalaharituber pfeilii]|nr:hypothetical protein BDZ91DRAFT_649312 [Kalaharituber pfeilii]
MFANNLLWEFKGAGCQAAYGACSGSPESTTTTSLPSPTGSRPRLGNVPYGVTLTSCTVPGTVALTFDDGPHIYTQELLSILNAEGVKATFFVNGQNWGAPITSDSSLAGAIRDVYNSGHQIASHTWSHPNLDSLDAASIKSQMNQLEGALLNIIGRYPTYMRAPYLACGGTCLSVMNELGYHVMGTNLDTLDWQFNTDTTNWQSQQIFNNAVSSTSGSTGKWLVLSHDVHRTTVKLLAEYMIETAQQKGYRLVTVGECMGDPSSNWYRTSL